MMERVKAFHSQGEHSKIKLDGMGILGSTKYDRVVVCGPSRAWSTRDESVEHGIVMGFVATCTVPEEDWPEEIQLNTETRYRAYRQGGVDCYIGKVLGMIHGLDKCGSVGDARNNYIDFGRFVARCYAWDWFGVSMSHLRETEGFREQAQQLGEMLRLGPHMFFSIVTVAVCRDFGL
jgi:hypothetical protein